MSKPVLLLSDLHYHSWTAFAEKGATGVNTRLQQILDATNEAVEALKAAGGKTIIVAGDVFHKRGSVEPSVLNPVMDAYKVYGADCELFGIPGNHDLEKNDSERLSNAITALETCGMTIAHEPYYVEVTEDWVICLFPWYSSTAELIRSMELFRDKVLTSFNGELEQIDAVIHAPIDGVLPHLPAHGLDADAISRVGFDRVFSGHYHHHKDMGRGVYSIGALTHQNWGDIGSKAGYMLIWPDREEQFETSHPKFVELTGDEKEEEAKALVKGNYVRVRAQIEKDSELKEIRDGVMAWGAKGVSVIPVRKTTITRTGATPTTTGGVAIETSIKAYLDKKGARPEAHTLALSILSEARGL